MKSEKLLSVQNLKTHFSVGNSIVKAVDGVSFDLESGKTFAIVGESGSGKSITALSIMGLLPNNLSSTDRGKIIFNNQDLINLEEKEMRKIRGNSISMIFQEPMTSLNPVYDLSFQISEVIMLHQNKNKKDARKIAIEMLDLVGIPEPQKRIDSFPHELSGGMRQRAMIAMALSCNPKILIADEPTTALDVTIQAQIIELMKELQKKLGMSIIFITHDLGVVSEISDHVMVMYLGNVMEIAETNELFSNPLHSYTKSLIDIAPQITEEKRKIRLLKGEIPSPIDPPSGCVFRTRCPNPTHECKNGISTMGLIEPKPGHFVDQCCYECH
ncbi:MAG: Oligopeptide transport ATP-binding protein OppD [Alphaproteobacteria bacterium MarineAlpha5_Bin12]|nr:MAG: Oligopeptide transport ATP-binding protein OppD [Alphaproteobacteria bacterium MarineAlpha5_Bin12]|tara:strand:+ start:1671 stop:2654 length:984 start_codon:yes stop_codon:yes gene_type:complete